MRTTDDRLEDSLRDFLSALDRELATLHRLTRGIATLFTEMALGLCVLEHALRRKGILDDGDTATALRDAQAALARIGGDRPPASSA